MVRFEEMTVGARRIRGPISDLVDLDRRGVRHVAVAFHDDYRDDHALGAGLDPYRDFLELTMVEGVPPVVAYRRGVFAYPAPEGRTVRELIGVFAEEGGSGSRAALELLAEILVALTDAAKAGADRGLRSHGSLDPWRVLVDAGGKVTILGYGLPPLDVLDYQKDSKLVPAVDSMRYCPPERLEGEPEDWTSDLFGVALMVAELATGRPVYDGKAGVVFSAVTAGDAAKRLEAVPRELAAVIRQPLAALHDQRPTDPRTVIAAARTAAARAPGRTLSELVAAARPYLSDVEEDLPPGTPILDIVGPPPDEPQRKAAVALATEVAARATATVDALAAQVESTAGAVDATLDGVPESLRSAEAALATARAAAERADRAADQAMQAVDARSAEGAAAGAVTASDEVEALRAQIDEALAQGRRITDAAIQAAAERRDRAVAAARDAVMRAERALAEIPPMPGGISDTDDVEEQVGAAKAAARKAESARDPGSAERASERAVAAAIAAGSAAASATRRAVEATERVTRARDALAAAEAAHRDVPTAAVTAALEAARAIVAQVEADPDAVDRALAATNEVERLAAAATAEREQIRRRAWVAVARADACGRGFVARAEAEAAEAALDPEEALGATLRAEAAADRAEAELQAERARIDNARAQIEAAIERIAQTGNQWNPAAVEAELAAARSAAESASAASTPEEAEVAAAAADRAAEEASARAKTATRALAVIARRAATTLEEALAEGEHPETVPHLEEIRAAAARVASEWDPDQAEVHAASAEQALVALRAALEVVARIRRARERAWAAVRFTEQIADKGDIEGILQLETARLAAAEADGADEPSGADAAADRAEEAARAAQVAVEQNAVREALLETHRARATAAVQRAIEIGRSAATEGDDGSEPEGIGLVRAAEAEARNSRDPDDASAAADRAERATEAVKVAVAKRLERDRLLAQLRERARKAAHRAVDFLDRIDAEDVRYVEAARAALVDADRATDLGLATAAVERAGQAVAAVKAAADRRLARETELARLRARAQEHVEQGRAISPWDEPPEALAATIGAAKAAAAVIEHSGNPAEAQAALAALDAAVEGLKTEAARWNRARKTAILDARTRADAAVAKLANTVGGQPALIGFLERGRAAAGRAAVTEDQHVAIAAADDAEAAAAEAFGMLERRHAVQVARERASAAVVRVEEITRELVDISPHVDEVRAAATEAEGTDDPIVAGAAAERAELGAAAAAAAIEAGRQQVARSRERAIAAVERVQRAVGAHPSLAGQPFLRAVRSASEEAARTKHPDRASDSAERAEAAAEAAEAALAAARESDRANELRAQRDRVEAPHKRAVDAAAAAPYVDVRELLEQLGVVTTELGASTDLVEATSQAERAIGLAEAVTRSVLAAAREQARDGHAELERASARLESADLQLLLEVAREALAEAERTEDPVSAVAAAESAIRAATDGRTVLEAEIEAERAARHRAAVDRARAAVQRIEVAVTQWEFASTAPGLDAAREAAAAAETAADPKEANAAADRAHQAAVEAVETIRRAGLVSGRERADLAVHQAEAAAIGFDDESVRKLVQKVADARAAVDAATGAAAASAAAARAEWAVPAVVAAVNVARVAVAKDRAAAAVARLEALPQAEPEIAAHAEAARIAARDASRTTDVAVAEAAAQRAATAVEAAEHAALDLDRIIAVRAELARIGRATNRVQQAGAVGAPFLDRVLSAAAEAHGTSDPLEVAKLALRAEEAAGEAEAAAAAEAARSEAEAAALRAEAHQRATNHAQAALSAARAAASEAPDPPPDASAEVEAAFAEVTNQIATVRALAEEAANAAPPRDAELAELAWVRSMAVPAAIERTNHVLVAWRRSQNRAAADRARSAVARAQDAAKSAAAIREDLSIGRTVRQAERAAAAAEAALEPADADWSAAMAVSAADRAQDLLTILLDEVRSSLSTLSALQRVKDDAEAELGHLPPGTAMALGTAMRTSWASAEHAARRGEHRAVEAAIKELRALAARITDEARRARPPPLPLSRVVPGNPRVSNPTLSPSDFDALGIEEAITAQIEDPPSAEDDADAETHTTIMTREQLAQRVQRAIAGDVDEDEDSGEEDEDDLETQQTVLFRRPVGARRADDDPTRS